MNVIKKNLDTWARNKYNEDKKFAEEHNKKSCAVCGKDEYIVLYRNVVGKVEANMYGSFSLFNGSVTGWISGETKTLPILSCRNCKNEKYVETYKYPSTGEKFWEDMQSFYFDYNEEDREPTIKDVYLNNPIDTRQYMLDNRNYKYTFYNRLAHLEPSEWKEAGFRFDTEDRVPINNWFGKIFKLKRDVRWDDLMNN